MPGLEEGGIWVSRLKAVLTFSARKGNDTQNPPSETFLPLLFGRRIGKDGNKALMCKQHTSSEDCRILKLGESLAIRIPAKGSTSRTVSQMTEIPLPAR